jgi:menaquinone-dependent protoporphyrinogen oxidase
MDKTLVAYATKTGTTREIALEIETALRGFGAETAVLPVSEVRSLDDFGTVIVGGPINGMRWVPEAAAFVEKHGDALRSRRVALFAVSYMYGVTRPRWRRAIEKSVDAAAQGAGARTVKIFGGRVDGPLPGFARVLFGLPKDLPLDTRNLDAIREWARGLPEALAG